MQRDRTQAEPSRKARSTVRSLPGPAAEGLFDRDSLHAAAYATISPQRRIGLLWLTL